MANVGDNPGSWQLSGGAAMVAPTGPTGAADAAILSAKPASGSGDADTEYFQSTTGWKRVVLKVMSGAALTAGQALMVAYSGTAARQADLTTILNSYRTALGTPDGTANSYAQCAATLQPLDPIVIDWDGVTTIKTVSVASQATTTHVVHCTRIG